MALHVNLCVKRMAGEEPAAWANSSVVFPTAFSAVTLPGGGQWRRRAAGAAIGPQRSQCASGRDGCPKNERDRTDARADSPSRALAKNRVGDAICMCRRLFVNKCRYLCVHVQIVRVRETCHVKPTGTFHVSSLSPTQ